MSFRIEPISAFLKAAKRLLKKYPSLAEDLRKLNAELSANPTLGTSIGKGCYKIRLAISSKNTGKSGGARVITCVIVTAEIVYLLDIYDKSEKADISDAELKAFLKLIPIQGAE